MPIFPDLRVTFWRVGGWLTEVSPIRLDPQKVLPSFRSTTE